MIQNYEVIQRIIELMHTIEEGILHIKKQLTELRYEESLVLFKDSVEGIISIKNALIPLELEDNNIDKFYITLNDSIGKVMISYEQGKQQQLYRQVEDIFRDFIIWRDEVETILKPHTLS